MLRDTLMQLMTIASEICLRNIVTQHNKSHKWQKTLVKLKVRTEEVKKKSCKSAVFVFKWLYCD